MSESEPPPVEKKRRIRRPKAPVLNYPLSVSLRFDRRTEEIGCFSYRIVNDCLQLTRFSQERMKVETLNVPLSRLVSFSTYDPMPQQIAPQAPVPQTLFQHPASTPSHPGTSSPAPAESVAYNPREDIARRGVQVPGLQSGMLHGQFPVSQVQDPDSGALAVVPAGFMS